MGPPMANAPRPPGPGMGPGNMHGMGNMSGPPPGGMHGQGPPGHMQGPPMNMQGPPGNMHGPPPYMQQGKPGQFNQVIQDCYWQWKALCFRYYIYCNSNFPELMCHL